MKDQYKVFLSVGVPLFVFIIALLAQFYAPSPYKEWGGVGILTLTASLLVMRAVQVIFGNLSARWIPYIVITYFVLSLVMVFASGRFQIVAGVVFLSLTGIAAFYWIVAIVIDEAKKIGHNMVEWANGLKQKSVSNKIGEEQKEGEK